MDKMLNVFVPMLIIFAIALISATPVMTYNAGIGDARKEAIDAGVAYYTDCGEFRWKEME